MNRRLKSFLLVTAIAITPLAIGVPARASVSTICATEATYAQCGRVFPDPQASLPFDPYAEGLLPAADFIQFGTGEAGTSEIWDGLAFLRSRYERYLDVWTLEDLLDEPDARSAGLWLAGQRQRLPLILARVTDETVPAEGKRRFVFGLSLHGIERAGVEGGTRALEDFVTYASCEELGSLAAAQADPVCSKQTQVRLGAFAEGVGGFPARMLPWDADSLTMGQVLKSSELYFTYNNPDGWHRGDKGAVGGVAHYQRYNGNGVDPNRDWPAQGYVFEPYTAASEPETKYFAEALRSRGGNWASGIDLHGMHLAPVLTYTMLPAGQHDYRKNQRIREIAQRTQFDAGARLGWSPLIADEDNPVPPVPLFLGTMPVGPQLWGTVWDTLDYTVTGAYGDWMDNPVVGLDAIGMDNEMAFSHITNCGIGTCFVPEVEQLHVAGNKGLIYADIDTTLRTEDVDYRFPFEGRGAYVSHDTVASHPGSRHSSRTAGRLPSQEDITGIVTCAVPAGPANEQTCAHEFTVEGPAEGVFNGGLRASVGFIGTHTINDETGGGFKLQRFVDDHPGQEGEWETVAENFTAGQTYLPNGMTAAINDPVPGVYRLLLGTFPPGPYSFEIAFSKAGALDDPGQLAYRATNLDFFDELNKYLSKDRAFDALDRARIAGRASVLDAYDVVVVPEWRPSIPMDDEGGAGHGHTGAFERALRGYVKRGGTVVLLDGALELLQGVTGRKALAPAGIIEYAGWVGFNDGDGTTYDDPLAHGVNVPGAAEGSGNRHQTYEPVPLGFALGDVAPDDSAPVWGIPQDAFEQAGGRVAGTTEAAGVTLGELTLGKGAIRIAGALLPTPSQDFPHPFGLASYGLTYSGWQLFENLVNVEPRPRPAPREPRVLAGRELPRTGAGAGALVFVLALVLAALAARRLRDIHWL